MGICKIRSVCLILLTVSLISSNIGESECGNISESLLSKLSLGFGNFNKADAVLELPSVMPKVLSNPSLNLFTKREEKASFMTTLMKQYTSESQAPFLSVIKQFGAEDKVTPFFVTNAVHMKNVDLPLLNALSAIPGPFTIREPYVVEGVGGETFGHNPNPVENISSLASRAQWGVTKIEATYVWDNYGIYGTGILVASIDSGVYWGHESLRHNFAGGWLDTVGRRSEPYDDHGHGTHTMGTICGRARGIGVAPGASWIACKALNSQLRGSEESLLKCGEWLFKQRPLPRIINNSWGGPGGNRWYNDVILSWKSVGIIPVFSIGSSGNQCSTALSPADQDGVISVGATDMRDKVTVFSSRGPAKDSNSQRVKPEISAPGFNIVSASNSGPQQYQQRNGTSMAAPHISGAIALMLEADPSLKFSSILGKLSRFADRPSLSKSELQCDPTNRQGYPNNAYGYGRMNVRKVIEQSS